MNIRGPSEWWEMPPSKSMHERDVFLVAIGAVLLVAGLGLIVLGLRFGGVL